MVEIVEMVVASLQVRLVSRGPSPSLGRPRYLGIRVRGLDEVAYKFCIKQQMQCPISLGSFEYTVHISFFYR